MTDIESIAASEKEQDVLKRNLLKGGLLPTEFFDKLLELDQSTPDRHQAYANYKILTDEAVKSFSLAQPLEVQMKYYKILGFTEFHLGQIKALEEGADNEALSFFKASLEHAHQAGEDEEWTAYVTATVAYFEKNFLALDEASQSPEITGNNRLIIENMKKGLSERGDILYMEDYRVE